MIFGGIWIQLLDFLLMTVIYRKIINNADMEEFQKDLDRLGGVGGLKYVANKSK